MTDQEQTITEAALPTCYRHPTRETRVSCGRCGRPLCPDCMRHGPVGVRCPDCLRPARAEMNTAEPERVGLAIGVACGEALIWSIILLISGVVSNSLAPNFLLSGLAGGMIGWTIWRICRCRWNARTLCWAIGLGIAMPTLATVGLMVLTFLLWHSLPWLMLAIRDVPAIGISVFFAWIFSTRRRGGRTPVVRCVT